MLEFYAGAFNLYVCIVFFVPDTYKNARAKLPQAERTSCLETDQEEDKATSRQRRQKTFSDTADDDFDSDDVEAPVSKTTDKNNRSATSEFPLPEPPVSLQGIHLSNQGIYVNLSNLLLASVLHDCWVTVCKTSCHTRYYITSESFQFPFDYIAPLSSG